jgi:hypothetical protein
VGDLYDLQNCVKGTLSLIKATHAAQDNMYGNFWSFSFGVGLEAADVTSQNYVYYEI